MIPSPNSLSREQINTLVMNRGAKEHRRRAMASAYTLDVEVRDELPGMEARADLRTIKKRARPADIMLLLKLGEGYTYRELSIQWQSAPSTIKVKAHRARVRLKQLVA